MAAKRGYRNSSSRVNNIPAYRMFVPANLVFERHCRRSSTYSGHHLCFLPPSYGLASPTLTNSWKRPGVRHDSRQDTEILIPAWFKKFDLMSLRISGRNKTEVNEDVRLDSKSDSKSWRDGCANTWASKGPRRSKTPPSAVKHPSLGTKFTMAY